jgi:hypothetical protein
MNESSWQPPSDGASGRPDLPPPDSSPGPSPWSPDGAASWPGSAPDDGAVGVPRVPPPPAAPPADQFPADQFPADQFPSAELTLADQAVAAAAAPPTEPSRKRSKLVVAAAVAAVGALGVAGLFAVRQFSGQAVGGAETADELGFDLLAAIEAEDVLGVIDTMSPGERDTLGEPFVEMVAELQRLEILSVDTDLSRLIGLDVELTRETVRVQATNVPDIVNVSLEAQATVTLDGATLPLGDFIEDQLPEDALADLRATRETQTDELSIELTAVLEDDRWYFSVFHTIAELARADAGDDPIPADGVVAAGGDSPEAAVDRLLDSIEQLDLRGVIAILDPAEAAALQRYAPLFLDVAEAELAEVPLEWRIDVRDFRVEGSGAERTVFIDAIGVSGEAEGSTFSFGFDGECFRGELDGESFEECASSSDAELESLFEDAPAIEAFTVTLEEAFADIEPTGLELRQRDGAWFVSPLATGSEAFLAVFRALDRPELDAIVDDGTAAAEEFFDVFLGGFDLDFDDGFGFDDGFDDDGFDDDGFDDGFDDDGFDDDGFDDGFDDDGFDDDGFDDDGSDETLTVWDECYAETTASDAAACFDRYVATGEIDVLSVPATLLHPECGLAELTWEGGLYSATDEEFAAALEIAVPCFQALVDSGELEEWMVPFEVSYAECFEGRNWYTEFDDDEYNDRVDACMSAGG